MTKAREDTRGCRCYPHSRGADGACCPMSGTISTEGVSAQAASGDASYRSPSAIVVVEDARVRYMLRNMRQAASPS